MPPPWPPPPPPPPPPANAIVGETRPMDATANNAITVLRNITILRQRYIAPNHDWALEVGIVLKNRYQLRRVRYSTLREPRLIKFKFSERVVRGARRRGLPGWRLLSRQLAERNASMEHRWHRHHRMHRGNERRNGQAVIALYRHYKNGHRP